MTQARLFNNLENMKKMILNESGNSAGVAAGTKVNSKFPTTSFVCKLSRILYRNNELFAGRHGSRVRRDSGRWFVSCDKGNRWSQCLYDVKQDGEADTDAQSEPRLVSRAVFVVSFMSVNDNHFA